MLEKARFFTSLAKVVHGCPLSESCATSYDAPHALQRCFQFHISCP